MNIFLKMKILIGNFNNFLNLKNSKQFFDLEILEIIYNLKIVF